MAREIRRRLNPSPAMLGFLLLDVSTPRSYILHIGNAPERRHMKAERMRIGKYRFAFIYLTRLEKLIFNLPFQKRRENLLKSGSYRVSSILWVGCRNRGADMILLPNRPGSKSTSEK